MPQDALFFDKSLAEIVKAMIGGAQRVSLKSELRRAKSAHELARSSQSEVQIGHSSFARDMRQCFWAQTWAPLKVFRHGTPLFCFAGCA